jgi:hypothetical protein
MMNEALLDKESVTLVTRSRHTMHPHAEVEEHSRHYGKGHSRQWGGGGTAVVRPTPCPLPPDGGLWSRCKVANGWPKNLALASVAPRLGSGSCVAGQSEAFRDSVLSERRRRGNLKAIGWSIQTPRPKNPL